MCRIEKISASSIYDCDNVSFNGICTQKGRDDFDWSSKIYPGIERELKRPFFYEGIYFRYEFDGFYLNSIYFTYIGLSGNECVSQVKFDIQKRHGDYIVIPVNITINKWWPDKEISTNWLSAIYKNDKNKFVKVIWYY